MINRLPLLIQATVPSSRLRILNIDDEFVQDDDKKITQFPTNTLTEEARHTMGHITEGLANNTIRAFVVFVLVDNGENHMFAVVQKLGVWFILDSATQK
jgi:hypothetical protein